MSDINVTLTEETFNIKIWFVWPTWPTWPAWEGIYTDLEIKTKYENNADTNAFTDDEKTQIITNENDIDILTDAIANLASAQGTIINDDVTIISDTKQIISFSESVASTDIDIFEFDDVAETITFKKAWSFNFISTLNISSTTNSTVNVTFSLEKLDDTIMETQTVSLDIQNWSSEVIPLNTLLIVEEVDLPLTIDVNAVSDISWMIIDSFNSILISQTTSWWGVSEWGAITGVLANQTDLQTVLDTKAENINWLSDWRTTANSLFLWEWAGVVNTWINNLAEWYMAWYSNTIGSGWTAQGYQAWYSNTTGSGWTAQGYQAWYSNTTGSYWMAQGIQSWYSSKTGSYWIAQGYQAWRSNTTGSNWTAQGYQAWYSSKTGSYWIAQGGQAWLSNTTGNYWIAQGGQAWYSNTTGSNWIAQGVQAWYSNTTGSNWIAQGFRAWRYIADWSTPLLTINNSLFIWANTKALVDNSLNEIVIWDSATGNWSNTVTIWDDSIIETYQKGAIVNSSLSSDPADPTDWKTVQWVALNWDVKMKINVWWVVKTVVLVDFGVL